MSRRLRTLRILMLCILCVVAVSFRYGFSSREGVQAEGVAGPLYDLPPFIPESGAYVSRFGDFDGVNGDDLATISQSLLTDQSVGTVTVRLNDGTGHFGAPAAYPLGVDARQLTAVDLDGDGNMDLLATGSSGVALIGNGDGTFTQLPSFLIGSFREPAFADYNEDGILDFVAVSTLYLGIGGGFFADGVGVGIGAQVTVTADLDGDTHADLIATTGGTTVAVALGVGDGNFGPEADYPSTVQATTGIAVADMDGDTFPDVMVGSGESDDANSAVAVLSGNGDGTLASAVAYPIPFDAVGDLVVANLDGDADPDLVGVNYVSSVVFVMSNPGDGSLVNAGMYPMRNDPFYLDIGDANGDNDPDVAVSLASFSNNPASDDTGTFVFLGTAGTGFDAPQALAPNGSAGSMPYGVVLADMDKDGNVDLVIGQRETPKRGISIALGNGDGTFDAPTYYSMGTARPLRLAIADFNEDTFPDVAWTFNGSPGSFSGIALNDGAGGLGGPIGVGSGQTDIAVGDFNEDGFADIVYDTNNFFVPAASAYTVHFGDGTGAFPTTLTVPTGNIVSSFLVTDIDGDTHDDILFAKFPATPGELGVSLGNGDGTFDPFVTYATPGALFWLKLGDVNEDTFPDIVGTHSTAGGGGFTVMPGNGDGTFDAAVDFPIDNNASDLALADMDGDGHLDVLPTAQSPNGALEIYAGNGDMTFDDPESYAFTWEGADGISVGQFDGADGLDIAFTNDSSYTTVILQNGNGSLAGPADGTLTQSGYKFFANQDTSDVGAPLAATDTPATLTSDGQTFRLRLLLRADEAERQTDAQQYRLQVSPKSGTCDAAGVGESYADVTNASGDIRYGDNPDVSDSGANSSSFLQPFIPNSFDPRHGSIPVYREGYNDAAGAIISGEGDFFDAGVAGDQKFNLRLDTVIPVGAEGMWDFALKDFSAPGVGTYCVRAVRQDDSPLDGYEQVAEFTTSTVPAVASFTQSAYRWFENNDGTNPGIPLAAQDTPVTLASAGAEFRLRILTHVADFAAGPGSETFKLQEAARSGACDAAGVGEAYADVTTGTGAFQYLDQPSAADNDPFSNTADDPVHAADSTIAQTYNEPGDDAFEIVNSIAAGQDGEWDFSLKDASATPGATYCFRAVTSGGGALSGYSQIAELTAAGSPGGGGGGGGNPPPTVTPAVTVIAPNGGETLDANALVHIFWSTQGRVDLVNLAYSTDAGSTWKDVARGIQNAGSFVWPVPDESTSEALVRVEATDTVTAFATDASDRLFSIRGTKPEEPRCGINIDLSPGDGDPAAACIREGDPGSRTNPLTILRPGMYVRTVGDTSVYFITDELTREPVLDARTFFTHEDSFGIVVYVTPEVIATARQDEAILPKPGSVLLTFWDGPVVYAIVENPADPLRPILRAIDSERLATDIYGTEWRAHVLDFNPAFHVLFEEGPPVFSFEPLPLDPTRSRDALSRRAGIIRIESVPSVPAPPAPAAPGRVRSVLDFLADRLKRR